MPVACRHVTFTSIFRPVKKEHIHFIAIGGSAMHSLAIALSRSGKQVSGSDDEIFDPARSSLYKAGILPESEGWFPDKIHSGLSAVILGMHARADNPELARARELGLTIYSYPEYLHIAYANARRIVIGGSHGKTTITSMILHLFNEAGLDTDYMVGARLKGLENPLKISGAALAVIEGDEYLTSALDRRPKFHLYKPHIAIISGIAWDHINVFPTFENYTEQFRIFTDTIEPGGHLIANAEDEAVIRITQHIRSDIQLHLYRTPDYYVENGETFLQTENGPLQLQIFGQHNLLNAMAAVKVAELAGIPREKALQYLAGFSGAEKRLEKLCEQNGRSVYKDFAHAPSKVRSTLSAFLEKTGEALSCFELHTFSSLNKEFLPQYHNSLNEASEACLFYSPHALELKRMPPLSEADIQAAFAHPSLYIFTDPEELRRFILSRKERYRHLLMMSSGNWDGLDLTQLAADFCTI